MCDKQCDYLLPSYNALLTPGNEHPECLRRQGHDGHHLVKIHTGEYVTWYPDCPDDCKETDWGVCECFTYGYVSEATAEELKSTP